MRDAMSQPIPGDNVLFQFFRTGQVLRAVMAPAVEGSELSGEEYGVISLIGVQGPISPTDLAARLGMPPTSVSRHVARFLREGYVARLPNEADGRSYLLEMTDAGRAVARPIAERLYRIVQHELAGQAPVPLSKLTDALLTLEETARAVIRNRTT